MLFQLNLIIVQVRLITLQRGIDDRDEEVIALDGLQEIELLFHTLHCGAAFGAEHSAEMVVAALNGALQNGADVRTGTTRHVVGRNVGRGAARRAQTRGEAVAEVQKHFRDIIAVIAQSALPFVHRLLNELILRVLQEILEEDQMFQVFHSVLPSLLSFDRSGGFAAYGTPGESCRIAKNVTKISYTLTL